MMSSSQITPAGLQRRVLPSQIALAAELRALADARIAQAYDSYQEAKKQTARLAQEAQTGPDWPATPSLLNPSLRSSYVRRHSEKKERLQSNEEAIETLWQRYQNEIMRAHEQEAIVNGEHTPPRIIDLFGGIDAYAALPHLILGKPGITASAPDQLQPQDLQAPVTRGRSADGRLFVSVVFHKISTSGGDAAPGIISLVQAYPQPGAGWCTINPQRLMPESALFRSLATPTFPNMAGRGALAGGADAQLMLQALRALVQTGQAGAYRLGPGPSACAEL